MSVGLSTLKKGDKVRRRDGKIIEVISVELNPNEDSIYPYRLDYLYQGMHGSDTYRLNGRYLSNDSENSKDLIKVISDKKRKTMTNITTRTQYQYDGKYYNSLNELKNVVETQIADYFSGVLINPKERIKLIEIMLINHKEVSQLFKTYEYLKELEGDDND